MKKIIILYNGIIVLENKILLNHSIILFKEIIKNIVANNEINQLNNFEKIDCTNKYIVPGLIDIHSDAIEKNNCS